MWSYYKNFIENSDELFPYLLNYMQKQNKNDNGRTTIIFGTTPSYGYTKSYNWSDEPLIYNIGLVISEGFDHKPFDYCLVHLYHDGSNAIMWHADKEALDTLIASVSFGATRKFRFRKIGVKYEHGKVEDELSLSCGDLVLMHAGCRKKYLHTVPKELTVTLPRINLTFRYIS